jgi:nitrile hydratase
MNGIHDMGGMDNMGPLVVEQNEPRFHADWERTIFPIAIALLGAGYFKLDEVRRATETIPPGVYLNMPYYEGWMRSIVSLLLEKKLITEEELTRGRARSKPASAQALPKEMALFAIHNNIPTRLDVDVAPRFRPGDGVMTRNMHTWRHTRMPRYARGRQGRIEADHGVYLLPDTNAHGGPDRPQHLYSVRFTARELWGSDAPARDAIYVDLWEEYLEPGNA